MQILGGAGYLRGSKVERIYRETKVLTIGGGSLEIMKGLAARRVGYGNAACGPVHSENLCDSPAVTDERARATRRSPCDPARTTTPCCAPRSPRLLPSPL